MYVKRMPTFHKRDSTDSKTRIDELDITIIKELLKDSRKSFPEIAKQCKVSTATINNRFNDLKKAGIIKGSSVIVNLSHYGVQCDGNIFLNIVPEKMPQFLKDMQNKLDKSNYSHPIKLNEKVNAVVWSPITNIRDFEKLKELVKRHPAVIDLTTDIWTYMKVIPDNLAFEA